MRRLKAQRYFQERVYWPILDARDWALRRGPATAAPVSAPRERAGQRMRRRTVDRWDYMMYVLRRSPRSIDVLSALVLLAVAAAAVALAFGPGANSPDTSAPAAQPASANVPPDRV